jgi:predicted DNA-binding protein (UPF0251 family)
MQGFKPFGIPARAFSTLSLHFDEYESIRLLDYENLTQEEASEKMNVSRPTLTRIYENARKTIARAFVEGKAIVIDGGKVQFDDDWFRCKKCFKLIQGLENHIPCRNCKSYSVEELEKINT